MAKKKYNSISDIPSDELKNMMIAFWQKKLKVLGLQGRSLGVSVFKFLQKV